MDYQDAITFTQEEVRAISPEVKELFYDERLKTIIIALRKGPMTVRDLEEEYNKIIEKQIENMDIPNDQKSNLKSKSKRKGKTLYKYLDKLIKSGLVVEAGRRIRKGQTATETLFGRTAKIFISSGTDRLTKFETDEVWKVLANIIRERRDKKSVDLDCFINTFKELIKYIHSTRVDVFTKYSKDLSEISTKISQDSLTNINTILEMFYILDVSTEFKQKFDKCFS